jgi:hypothetical protein
MDRQGTVVQHFVAGGIGGIANAILLLLLESVKIIPSSYSSSSSSSATSSSSSSSNASPLKYGHCWTTNTNYNRLLLPSLSYHHLHVPTFRYATSLVLHNTLSHSILFGTYQLSKQCIEQQRHRMIGQLEYTRDGLTSANNGSSGGTNINNNRHDDINDHNDNIVQFATIATIAIAGGVAGQSQFVASYMSERWLGLVIDETTHAATAATTTKAAASTMKAPLSSTLFHNLSSSSSSSSNISLRRHRNFITSFYSTVPTVRSIVLSFPSSAIGFLAYEYGKLMME